MNRKKILFFAPYGAWQVHHQVDAVLALALQQRGCDVAIIGCDGLFEDCNLSRSDETFCRHCASAGSELFLNYQLPVIQLRSLLTQNDIQAAKSWAESLNVENFPFAVFEGCELGKCCEAGIHSYFSTAHLDLSNAEVVKQNRSFLFNGALITCAFNRILQDFYPDHVVCFHSIQTYYRVFYELSRNREIPVLVHERGLIDDSFAFLENENNFLNRNRVASFEKWRDIPLSADECKWVKEHFIDFEKGKGNNVLPYYQYISDEQTVKKQLRIPGNAKIIAFYGSTDRELGMGRSENKLTFDSQIDGIKKLSEIFRHRDDFLVIRNHPDRGDSIYSDSYYLGELLKIRKDFPENVRIIMPAEKLSSYSIIWNSEAAITFGSTIGVESQARGVSACSNVDSIYTALGIGIEMVPTPDHLEAAIDHAIEKTQSYSVENLTKVYRGTFHLWCKLSFKFKSFGILDTYNPHIRFNDVKELSEGNDMVLDDLCSHILYGTPLYPEPSEEDLHRSAAEEKLVIKEINDEIRKKRLRVKQFALSCGVNHEPLLSVVRIRQNGIRDPQDTELAQAIKKSRYKNIEILRDIAFPFYSDYLNFLNEVKSAVNIAKGKYLFLGTDNTCINESLFSTAIDFLEDPENISTDCFLAGAWICDKSGTIINQIFTENIEQNVYCESIKTFNFLENPAQLLSFFVWRKSSIINLISKLNKLNEPENISSAIFDLIISEQPDFKTYRAELPMVAIHPPPKGTELTQEGISLYNEGRLDEAMVCFDSAKDLGDQEKYLDYYRVLTRVNLGRIWEAFAIAQSESIKNSVDDTVRNFEIEFSRTLDEKDIQYEDIASSVECIEGYLAPGQEKYLFDKVKSLPDDSTILEIGTCFGRSTAAMAFACIGTNKRIFVIDRFVDVYDADGNDIYGIEGKQIAFELSFYDIWYRNIYSRCLEKYVTPLIGTSHNHLAKWNDKPMPDFAFIDGSHNYQDVLKDFELVYPLVKIGGWIAFHDVEPVWDGPWRVWQQTAVNILSSHEYCSTIASGCKQYNQTFKEISNESDNQKSPLLNNVNNSASHPPPYVHTLTQAIEELQVGHNDKALRLFDQVISINNKMPAVNYGKAVALARLERRDEAAEILGTLLSVIPGHRKAELLLDEIIQ